MNAWMLAATLSSLALIPCADQCLRGGPERRLVGLEMTGLVLVLVFTMQCVGEGRTIFLDLPLTLAVVSFGSGLAFARFLEKYL